MKAINIQWETDDENVDLPTEVDLPIDLEEDDDDEITDYLSDEYDYLVNSYDILTDDGEIVQVIDN